MIKTVLLLAFVFSFSFGANQCVVCHKGIEDIRDRESGMMKAILKVAQNAGHEGNDCIVCHGGNPKSKSVKYAHRGTVKYFKTHKGPKTYYPAPGSSWINQNTCGVCHPNQVGAQMNSLMMSQQGKIQDTILSFGVKEGYTHENGTYKTKNPHDKNTRLGTQTYKKYMEKLANLEPQAFSEKTQELPDAPTVAEIHKDPSLAVFTYLRQECLHCHTGSKGRYERGGYRGIGCASCHVPYSKEGFYEGSDKKIKKKERGHMLFHQIQSSRKVKVQVNDINYSGIPVETCSSCHKRGKSIGHSYQGLMQTELQSSFEKTSDLKLMKEDVHFKKGMLCQDCHTSNDLHGDGFLSGANLGAVEIECQDCHGTTKAYPWELPIGYSDEFNTTAAKGEVRGVASTIPEYLKQGYVAQKEDGYLVTARGNPLPKAVKKGNKIIMHLASGKDIKLKPLKLLKEQESLSNKALIAMDAVNAHNDKMECYTCHATWAPQYYGNHVTIDYSGGKKNPDYVKGSHAQDSHEYLVDGQVRSKNSYIRWEDPALAQNGEGRISPVVPGYQTTLTVIGKNSKVLLKNHIFKMPHDESRVKKPQSAISMTPLQPHTVQKESRSCESCHTSDKALGLGLGGMRPNAETNYSQFVDKNATQVMRVGSSFKLSKALDKTQRSKLDRRGMCLACHQSIPEGNLAISAMTHISEMAELNIDNKTHQDILGKILNIGAWSQVVGVVLALILASFIIYLLFFKKKPFNPRNEGWK
jgi:hypothetical protein